MITGDPPRVLEFHQTVSLVASCNTIPQRIACADCASISLMLQHDQFSLNLPVAVVPVTEKRSPLRGFKGGGWVGGWVGCVKTLIDVIPAFNDGVLVGTGVR